MIAKEIGRRDVVREGVHDLLGGPARGGVFGHVEVDDAPAMLSEHDEDEEHPQARGGDREEIDADQVPNTVGEERPPGLGRRNAPLREQPGDRTLGHLDPQLQEFAMDSGGAPEEIGRGHSCDRSADVDVDMRSAPGRPAGELGPVLAEATPLPPQDGVRAQDHERLSPPGPDSGQPNPEEAVGSVYASKQVEQESDHRTEIVAGSEPTDQPLGRRARFWRRTVIDWLLKERR